MVLEVESDSPMISPNAAAKKAARELAAGNVRDNPLRLSEIENAHLCPSARMKMEELFRQWLNVDGTKEMIHSLVEDMRTDKEIAKILEAHGIFSSAGVVNGSASHAAMVSAAAPTSPSSPVLTGATSPGGAIHNITLSSSPSSTSSMELHSPSRSPKRPPNYYQQQQQAYGTSNSRKKQHLVSLFGEDLHLAAPENEESGATAMDTTSITAKTTATGTAVAVSPTGSPLASSSPAEKPATVEPMALTSSKQAVAGKAPLSPKKTASSPLRNQIPRFYIPGEGRRGRLRGLSTDTIARKSNDIEARFAEFPDGMKVEDFVAITKDLCGLPSFFNAPFFQRILASENVAFDEDKRITKDSFQRYWLKEMAPYDNVERFFRIVKQTGKDYIERDDFAPFLHELLKYHPGLEFLNNTPEFQEKYALTVVVRIFYSVDRDSNGRITLRKLRRSNLIEAFNCVDEEEDINKVNSYFSYEHFYVLYCKFWELDTDHDFLLSPDDLVRYGGHALTRIIIDRIFEHGRRPFARVQTLSAEEKKKMSYEDFIYFMLSEEDKGNPVSLKYWFELIDTNEDHVIRADEMRLFYRHQIHRMECLGHEVVPFEDILCQMADLLHPAVDGAFQFQDFIREDKIRIAGVFFNVLFNLSKFIEFEQRDPFLLRQQLAEPELTDWDRYARAEYARLAMEEEGREDDSAMEIDTMDGWYVSEEQDDELEMMNDSDSSKQLKGSSSSSSSSAPNRTAEAPF